MQTKNNTTRNLIENKLRERTTDQLMQDVRTAKHSAEEGSATFFCCALNVLEERLSEEEYIKFENSI